jgi:hypothetical protein
MCAFSKCLNATVISVPCFQLILFLLRSCSQERACGYVNYLPLIGISLTSVDSEQLGVAVMLWTCIREVLSFEPRSAHVLS